jgi:hypothetical protein
MSDLSQGQMNFPKPSLPSNERAGLTAREAPSRSPAVSPPALQEAHRNGGATSVSPRNGGPSNGGPSNGGPSNGGPSNGGPSPRNGGSSNGSPTGGGSDLAPPPPGFQVSTSPRLLIKILMQNYRSSVSS